MKKAAILLLALLTVSLACGCSRKNADANPSAEAIASTAATATPSANAEDTNGENTASAKTPVPPSSNKEVVTDYATAPEIYWLTSGDNNLTYHLKNCPLIKDKNAQKLDWSIAGTIGLRQCPECNPPQYEAYIDAGVTEIPPQYKDDINAD